MKKETAKKPNRTPIRIVKAFILGIRIIKAFILGMVSGMLLLEYIRNKKRPYLPCGEYEAKNTGSGKKHSASEDSDGGLEEAAGSEEQEEEE